MALFLIYYNSISPSFMQINQNGNINVFRNKADIILIPLFTGNSQSAITI